MKKRTTCFLLILILTVMTAGVCPSLYHAEESSEGVSSVVEIGVPFLNGLGHSVFQWDFPYSDDLFREPSDDFSLETARASMGLTVSAFRNHGELIEDQVRDLSESGGFF